MNFIIIETSRMNAILKEIVRMNFILIEITFIITYKQNIREQLQNGILFINTTFQPTLAFIKCNINKKTGSDIDVTLFIITEISRTNFYRIESL